MRVRLPYTTKKRKKLFKFWHYCDKDDILEYEESDILAHFKEFYDDVLEEIQKYGVVVQFLTCSNYLPHLRGNVYVEYQRYMEFYFEIC